MIKFTCTHCQAALSVSDEKAGHSATCSECGRTIQVPLAGAVAGGHAPLKPPAKAVERVEDGEIPLAEDPPQGGTAEAARQQQPVRAAGGRVIAPEDGRDEGEEGEIPLAEDLPRGGTAEAARQQQPVRAAGGRVIAPEDEDEGIKSEEIELAEEPGEKAKEAAQEEGPPATAGGLVITSAGDATVVSFQNAKILDAMVIETIGQELYALVEQRACRKLVLDLSPVKYLSSQMLGVLAALGRKAAGIKGRVVLCGVHSDLQKVFRLVRLDRVLPMVGDRQAALAMLNRP